MADEMRAKSLATLHPVEKLLNDSPGNASSDRFHLRVEVALVQQLEALTLAVLALAAPTDS